MSLDLEKVKTYSELVKEEMAKGTNQSKDVPSNLLDGVGSAIDIGNKLVEAVDKSSIGEIIGETANVVANGAGDVAGAAAEIVGGILSGL